MKHPLIYWDSSSDPRNAGWVVEDENGNQFQLGGVYDRDRDVSDEELIAQARAFSDGEFEIRR